MASSQLIARHARETSGRLAPAAHFAKFESRCIDRLARSIAIWRTSSVPSGPAAPHSRRPSSPSTPAQPRASASWTCSAFFAEFETNLRRERQLEGIAKAKAAGVYKGRPASIEAARAQELKARGMRPTDIAKALKIGRASVYRVLGRKAAN
jgi:hypothetical protein